MPERVNRNNTFLCKYVVGNAKKRDTNNFFLESVDECLNTLSHSFITDICC